MSFSLHVRKTAFAFKIKTIISLVGVGSNWPFQINCLVYNYRSMYNAFTINNTLFTR